MFSWLESTIFSKSLEKNSGLRNYFFTFETFNSAITFVFFYLWILLFLIYQFVMLMDEILPA